MFKYYRKEGCLYECRIKYASQMAGCIPWDYPTIMNMNDTTICTMNGYGEGPLKVFEMHMQNDSVLDACHCEPNCEEVAYHTEVKLFIESHILVFSFVHHKLNHCRWGLTILLVN